MSENPNSPIGAKPSPTPAQVHAHLSAVQMVAMVIAGLSGLVMGMQALPANVAWAGPTVLILGGLVAGLTGWVKAYNVPDGAGGGAGVTVVQVPPAAAKGGPSITLNSWAILVLAGTFLCGLAAMPGCAANEKNRVAQSIVATTAQAKLAQTLHDAGITTPAQEHVIYVLLKAEAAAEDAYYAALEAGDSAAMKAAKASWAAATAAAAVELAKYPQKKTEDSRQ